MKRGSITVFLSLILVLVFSFLLTTLEAARIRGATAYISMITDLAGDSFLATYYYPLFQNYRIFGVDAGDDEGFFSREQLAEGIEKNLTFGLSETSGGLLKFKESGVNWLQYTTLIEDNCEAFYSQIKQQVVLDGLSLGLDKLFHEEQFAEAGVVGEIYREQEEALAVTATVTEELLKLMELTDGIQMGSNGIAFDKNGRMQVNDYFIKQPVSLTKSQLKTFYDNEEVYTAVSGSFFRADTAADRISDLLLEVQWLEDCISAAEEDAKHDYEYRRSSYLSSAKTQYMNLDRVLEEVKEVLKEAIKITERLEKKQEVARRAVEGYETFLEGMKEKLSKELYEVFLKELEKMKIYSGLDERGFSLSLIKQSLQNNKVLLETLSLPRFSSSDISGMLRALSSVENRMGEYTVEGLWFSYGEIVVAQQTFQNITGFLTELLSTGLLSLVGVTKKELSDRSLSGKDLPSAGLEDETFLEELMVCIEEVRSLFRSGGMKDVLSVAGDSMLTSTSLELYSTKYFRCYGEVSPYTRLNYEREYLIFGKGEDKSNLVSMVLYLVAIRTLLNMVMILKQPDRVMQLETLSAGVAGFTGIPVLAAMVKYSILLLWSVEEAVVDVTALLQGKRIAVVSPGRVSFGELFLMNKAEIGRKADLCPDGTGAAYTDYLALVSLTRRTKEKTYRALDLIQENIRIRYRDDFRVRNVVTGISFQAITKLQPLFDMGVFSSSVYEIKKEKEVSY